MTRIKAFLSGRTQIVKVNGVESATSPVFSGIPQGSVLGPVLFVVYINDLLEGIQSEGLLFADDTKLFNQVLSREDALNLQKDINLLERWSKMWLLRFNPNKCYVLTFGKFENIRHTHRYQIYDKELEHVFEEKDIGVTFDSELTFEEHLSLKIKKANAIMGIIRRSFSFLDCALFKKLYVSFVRPHLEYAQVVWAPHLRKHIDMIENVQCRATKSVDGLSDLEYSDRLRRLNLPTMLYRRARGDLIEMYKHFHVYDENTLSSSFQPRHRSSRKHGFQIYQLKPKDGKRGIQTNSFFFRCASTWNNLPSYVVSAKDVNTFKKRLDDHWANAPMKHDHRPQSDL